jgi:hypothetical protein
MLILSLRKYDVGNWDSFLTTIEIVGNSTYPCADSELRLFEQRTDITLPESYIEYCKAIGPGIHNREFTVRSPCGDGGGWDLLNFGQASLEAFKDAVRFEIDHFLEGYPAANHDKMRWLEGILNKSLPFADNGFAEIFLWHLDSYSKSDQNYDIYRIGIDSLETACWVGRDFYRFIAEFIYEHKIDGVPLKNNNYPEIERLFIPMKVVLDVFRNNEPHVAARILNRMARIPGSL